MKIMVWLASGWGESVSAVNPGLSAKSPAVWRRSACDWGREKGRAGHEPALRGRFSLTGIDAVPPAESSDRLQRRAGRGGGRGLGQISWFAVNARAVCAARSSRAADRVGSDASG